MNGNIVPRLTVSYPKCVNCGSHVTEEGELQKIMEEKGKEDDGKRRM